jgi:hypothetical protein
LIETSFANDLSSFSEKLDNIISLKKKTSFFKKKNKLKNYLLFRTNFLKSNKIASDSFSLFSRKNFSQDLFNQSSHYFNSADYQLSNQEMDLDKLLELKRKTF